MFSYLIDKISNTKFETTPFKHLEINNFFKEEHFNEIINQKEINFPKFKDDNDLITYLENNNYQSIEFPGCITSAKDYIKWHKNKLGKILNVSSTEGFGMTYRLINPISKIIIDLNNFFKSYEFRDILSKKFNINLDEVTFDQGIQKYLDGYEISPHPDIRLKAVTFMININPEKKSEINNHHTHYMTIKKNYKYIQEYWEGNQDVDRCWLPWDWCETFKEQKLNNSIVIFAPNNESFHAVKANYNHLLYQRTQMYGNFWWKNNLEKILNIKSQPKWENFIIKQINQKPKEKLLTKIYNKIKKKI